MSTLDEERNGWPAAVPNPSGASDPALDNPRVAQALREYQAASRAGQRPERRHFLASHPDIAEALAECLDGLEFLQAAAPALRESSSSPSVAADAFQPEGPLGDFRIVREIGRGGMGIVYEAVQISLGRRVALKVLPFAAALDPKQLQRFKNEAQAAAHLHHTHIVPVFGVGCERGIHYYAMQFIAGQTLAALIQDLRTRDARRRKDEARSTNDERMTNTQAPMTKDPQPGGDAGFGIRASGFELLSSFELRHSSFFRTVAQLGIQAAEALEHAHQQGVVHRDIKPANLLMDEGGNLWITDFGLARLQGDAGLTLSGDLLGTVRYMSPEQAQGKGAMVDPRTDIYSLGATLYELLTLQPAYDGRDRQHVLRQIAEEELPPLRSLDRTTPAELETVVLKAMSKAPDERYASAQELADDLRRFLEDKPIQARRPTLRQRARKWVRRHRAVVTTIAAAAVLLLFLTAAGAVLSTWLILQEKAHTDAAYRAEALAREELECNLYFKTIALADRMWEARRVGRAEELLEQCPRALRGWEWHHLKRAFHQEPRTFRQSKVLWWNAVAFSPDGRRLAAANWQGTISVWDLHTGREIQTLQSPEKGFADVAFSPDGLRLGSVSWGATENVQLWDLITGRLIRTFSGHRGRPEAVTFSPDGRYLASSDDDGTVKVWDTATGQESRTLHGEVSNVAYHPGGKELAFAGPGSTVKICDVDTWQEIRTLSGHAGVVRHLAYSRDGRRLASGGSDRTVKIWDAATGQEIQSLRGHTAPISCVAFSPDGRRLVSAGYDGTVRLWDTATNQETLTLWRGDDVGSGVAFSPDGRQIAAAIRACVWIWDGEPLEEDPDRPEVRTLTGHRSGTVHVAFSPDGRRLASGGDDRMVTVGDLATGRQLVSFGGYRLPIRSVAFHPDGRRVAVSQGQHVRVWDTETGHELLPPQSGLADFAQVAYSPDGHYLAAVYIGMEAWVWDAATGKDLSTLACPGGINCVAFSPDGKRLAAGGRLGAVKVWDLTLRRELRSFDHAPEVHGLAFSPDGRRLALADREGTVRVCNSHTGQTMFTIRAHGDTALQVAFHPEGRLLASSSADWTVKLWSTATGAPLGILRGHRGGVHNIAFSPDGRHLFSASDDRTVRIWDVAKYAEQAKLIPGRPGD